MNSEDIRQEVSHDDHHRASLYEEIPHFWCPPSQPSTQPDMYDGSARVSITADPSQFVLPGTHRSVPTPSASTDKILLHVDYVQMDKHKDSPMKSPIMYFMEKYTYAVPRSTSNTKSLLRHKPVLKYGNPHKGSPSKWHLVMD